MKIFRIFFIFFLLLLSNGIKGEAMETIIMKIKYGEVNRVFKDET